MGKHSKIGKLNSLESRQLKGTRPGKIFLNKNGDHLNQQEKWTEEVLKPSKIFLPQEPDFYPI